MLAGEFTRFDVFKGPITDNQGNEVLADGVSLEQVDLDGFAQFGSPCQTCMYWWNENITAELPELGVSSFVSEFWPPSCRRAAGPPALACQTWKKTWKIVMTDLPYAVEMQDIVIRFPGVLANDHVNFALQQGEIHALLGENGAGKSTLMNVLSGLYKPNAGLSRSMAHVVSFNSPRMQSPRGSAWCTSISCW